MLLASLSDKFSCKVRVPQKGRILVQCLRFIIFVPEQGACATPIAVVGVHRPVLGAQ